jgi:hypothetical protein
MTPSGESYSEPVLEGRLVVNVNRRRRKLGRSWYDGPVIDIGSLGNESGSMALTPLELAALLDGPLERTLKEANGE